MVHINANLDLKTFKIVDTGRLNESLSDLSEELLYITFVARDQEFFNGARRYKGETHMHVVLPYEEVLATDNIDLLAYRYLHNNLDILKWMEKEKIKTKLQAKITNLEKANTI